MVKPDRQIGGRAVFTNEFPVNRTREVVGPMPLPFGWIPRAATPSSNRSSSPSSARRCSSDRIGPRPAPPFRQISDSSIRVRALRHSSRDGSRCRRSRVLSRPACTPGPRGCRSPCASAPETGRARGSFTDRVGASGVLAGLVRIVPKPFGRTPGGHSMLREHAVRRPPARSLMGALALAACLLAPHQPAPTCCSRSTSSPTTSRSTRPGSPTPRWSTPGGSRAARPRRSGSPTTARGSRRSTASTPLTNVPTKVRPDGDHPRRRQRHRPGLQHRRRRRLQRRQLPLRQRGRHRSPAGGAPWAPTPRCSPPARRATSTRGRPRPTSAATPTSSRPTSAPERSTSSRGTPARPTWPASSPTRASRRASPPSTSRTIGGTIYVTYAMQDAGKHDDVAGAGQRLRRRVRPQRQLPRPGRAAAARSTRPGGWRSRPPTFGAFAGDLLVGNFGDGRINAFNPTTRRLPRPVDAALDGKPIVDRRPLGPDRRQRRHGRQQPASSTSPPARRRGHGLFGVLDVVPEPSAVTSPTGPAVALGLCRRRLSR